MEKYVNKKGEYGILLRVLEFLGSIDQEIKEESIAKAMDADLIKAFLQCQDSYDIPLSKRVAKFKTILVQTFGDEIDLEFFDDNRFNFDIDFIKPEKPFMIVWNSEYDRYDLFQEKTFTIE